jgi:hypothetical protein
MPAISYTHDWKLTETPLRGIATKTATPISVIDGMGAKWKRPYWDAMAIAVVRTCTIKRVFRTAETQF